ncbi:MAG: cell wall hydrolase [Hyphomonadaceae bacterium]|nr:cell wall hydrolase [Hyphomonadaceae bacterium]
MSDHEQRRVVMRGVSVAVCAVAVTSVLPMINGAYQGEREEADARLRTTLFAELGDGAEAIRAMPDAPSLIAHPWIVRLEQSLERDSQSALGRYAALDRDRAALSSVVSFDPADLSSAETLAEEHKCLSEAVYYEARSESTSGQLAVAEVITNRVRDHRYPNSICDVVYQGATRTTGCQFTFTCDGSMALRPRGTRWEKAQSVAAQVILDLHERRTAEATHYHATYVDPIWNSGLVRTQRIGAHIFYRFPQGREWSDARARLAARRASEAAARIQTVSADAPAPAPKALQAIEPATTTTSAAAAP